MNFHSNPGTRNPYGCVRIAGKKDRSAKIVDETFFNAECSVGSNSNASVISSTSTSFSGRPNFRNSKASSTKAFNVFQKQR